MTKGHTGKISFLVDDEKEVEFPSLAEAIFVGFFWECVQCGRRTDDDEEEDEEDGNPKPELDPCCQVVLGGSSLNFVACSPACFDAEVAEIAKWEEETATLTAMVKSAWPDAVLSYCSTGWLGRDAQDRTGPAYTHGRFYIDEVGIDVAIDGRIWLAYLPRGFTASGPENAKVKVDKLAKEIGEVWRNRSIRGPSGN